MGMMYIPYKILKKDFDHKCPYCNKSDLLLEDIKHDTYEYRCLNEECGKIFVTVPESGKSDIQYNVDFPDESGLSDFEEPHWAPFYQGNTT